MPRQATLILLTVSLLLIGSFTVSAEEVAARRLLNALGCKGCHKLHNDGGTLAPELDHIGSRMTRDQIKQHLATHGSASQQQDFMPSYKTTSQAELTLLSDFLYNLQ